MTAQDKELFSQLYDRNYKRLLYAAIRIAHNPFTAEELTNEAFTILRRILTGCASTRICPAGCTPC